MELTIWTKDEDSGDLVPVKFGNVEELTIHRKETIRMDAREHTINIHEVGA